MLLVAGALAGDLTFRGLDLRSRQADAIIYSLLKQNVVDLVHDAEKNTISVRRSLLCPFYYDITDAPDLFAPLFVMACFAGGESVLAGIGRLKNKGAACSSHGDHRLAMALVVASLFADEPIDIDDTDCIAKSFPEFLDIFHTLLKP